MPFLSLFLAACAAGDPGDKAPDDTAPDDTADSADTGTDSADSADTGTDSADSADTGTPETHGTNPDEATPAPTFSVLNQLEQVRTRDDLLGHPTVMWFYPLAASSG